MKTIVARSGTKLHADLYKRANQKHLYHARALMTCNETHGKWRFEDVLRRDIRFVIQAKSKHAAESALRKAVRPAARPGRSCAVRTEVWNLETGR